MKLNEVTHKTTIINRGGRKVVTEFIGPQGAWSLEDAGRLTISGKAFFFYQGAAIADLSVLPELHR